MTRSIRLGIFIAVGATLLFMGLFAIGNRTFLFSSTVTVKSSFSRVAGLQGGAPVQYQGVNVGRVKSVRLPSAPGEGILVEMAISRDAMHLVRTNTQAQIKSDGLVGEQIVVLVSSEAPAEPVREGGSIPGVDPFDLFEISDKALAAVQGFERAAGAFEQIMHDVSRGEGTLGKIVYDPALYDELVATTNETRRAFTGLANTAEANAAILVDLADRATQGVESVLNKLDTGDGTLAKLLNDPALYDMMLASADTLRTIAADLRAVTSVAENAATWGALGSYRFAELMEAAKHNWLFKRYFEERGHMEQAPFEIRERAISETYRQLQERERNLLIREERIQRLLQQTASDSSATPASTTNTGTPGAVDPESRPALDMSAAGTPVRVEPDSTRHLP